ncbi:hypothetical protein C8J33_1333 [Rhizobium sp. PP-CC-3G-465]|nr:hypothetical protein C8J33_1333 [Rhizobium sp. PP-CC-3G-465]
MFKEHLQDGAISYALYQGIALIYLQMHQLHLAPSVPWAGFGLLKLSNRTAHHIADILLRATLEIRLKWRGHLPHQIHQQAQKLGLSCRPRHTCHDETELCGIFQDCFSSFQKPKCWFPCGTERPSSNAIVPGGIGTISFWHIAPRGTGSQHPENPVQHTAYHQREARPSVYWAGPSLSLAIQNR